MVPPAQVEAPAYDTRDHAMMRLAMDQALNASLHGEVPVGAVLVKDGRVIATGYNHPVGSHDPSAHAAMRCGSVLNLPAHGQLNHQTQVEGGLLAEECGRLLQDFFARRRAQRRAARDVLRAQQDELVRWAATLPVEAALGELRLEGADPDAEASA